MEQRIICSEDESPSPATIFLVWSRSRLWVADVGVIDDTIAVLIDSVAADLGGTWEYVRIKGCAVHVVWKAVAIGVGGVGGVRRGGAADGIIDDTIAVVIQSVAADLGGTWEYARIKGCAVLVV